MSRLPTRNMLTIEPEASHMQEQDVHITAKIIGSRCNYQCEYCFYLEKDEILGPKPVKMPDSVLQEFIQKYIAAHHGNIVEFVWHGGEPTLLGLPYFEKIITFQNQLKNGKQIKNVIQTNGSKIDKAWCEFFKRHDFLVGLSLDGPQHLHDRYRTQNGKGTFTDVMACLSLLQTYKVDYNILACVTQQYANHGQEIYEFFRSNGIQHIQFSPVIEIHPSETERKLGHFFSSGILFTTVEKKPEITQWSIN